MEHFNTKILLKKKIIFFFIEPEFNFLTHNCLSNMTFICYGDLCCLEHLQYKYRDSACHSIQIQKSSLAAIFHLQNGTNIPFSPLVCSLGVTLDPTLTFREHISNICKTAYFELRRVSSIHHYLSVDATKTLVCSFVL